MTVWWFPSGVPKTDQEGKGRKVGIPHGSKPQTCTVRALRARLEASGISEGPVFRSVNRHGKAAANRLSARSVAIVVKRAAELVGLDASAFAGHSLRAGLGCSNYKGETPQVTSRVIQVI